MKKIIKLTESDLTKIVKRVIKEQSNKEIIKLYADMAEKELVDTVSMDGPFKRTSAVTPTVECPSHIIGTNTKGVLRLQCDKYPIFYLYQGNKVVTSGFNSKASGIYCGGGLRQRPNT